MSYAIDSEIRQVVSQLRALDREIAVLHREYERLPLLFGGRAKSRISEQMSYLVGRRDVCARRLKQLKQLKQERDEARSAPAPAPRPDPRQTPQRHRGGPTHPPAARDAKCAVNGAARHPGAARPMQSAQRRSGMHKVQLQRSIDEAYVNIGELGQRIATMPITPERKALIAEHHKLIQQRRRWIAEINAV